MANAPDWRAVSARAGRARSLDGETRCISAVRDSRLNSPAASARACSAPIAGLFDMIAGITAPAATSTTPNAT